MIILYLLFFWSFWKLFLKIHYHLFFLLTLIWRQDLSSVLFVYSLSRWAHSILHGGHLNFCFQLWYFPYVLGSLFTVHLINLSANFPLCSPYGTEIESLPKKCNRMIWGECLPLAQLFQQLSCKPVQFSEIQERILGDSGVILYFSGKAFSSNSLSLSLSFLAFSRSALMCECDSGSELIILISPWRWSQQMEE